MRGSGRDAGHFNIRMMEMLLWFSTEGPTARLLLWRNELSSMSPHRREEVYRTEQNENKTHAGAAVRTEMIDEMQDQGFLWQNYSGLS